MLPGLTHPSAAWYRRDPSDPYSFGVILAITIVSAHTDQNNQHTATASFLLSDVQFIFPNYVFSDSSDAPFYQNTYTYNRMRLINRSLIVTKSEKWRAKHVFIYGTFSSTTACVGAT